MLLVVTFIVVGGDTLFPPPLIDQCDKNPDREAAEIVVAGILSTDVPIRIGVPMHGDPSNLLQLCKLTLQVENVMKGTQIPATISVYYFTWMGLKGPRQLGDWDKGRRRVLWLRRDVGVLRTICDGWDTCSTALTIPTKSGDRALAGAWPQ